MTWTGIETQSPRPFANTTTVPRDMRSSLTIHTSLNMEIFYVMNHNYKILIASLHSKSFIFLSSAQDCNGRLGQEIFRIGQTYTYLERSLILIKSMPFRFYNLDRLNFRSRIMNCFKIIKVLILFFYLQFLCFLFHFVLYFHFYFLDL